ncbi:MAG: response regulator transcription factor [Bacteroidales bacterium]|nr:response regulator transcription factor [Bacteroidales bacterium]
MSNHYKIVLADPSPITLIGLAYMIKELPEFEVVLKSTDMHTVMTRIHLTNPDILIVNPLMIDYSKRMMLRDVFRDLPKMKVIALTSVYFENQLLKQYDGIIEINDSLQRIKSTLRQVIRSSRKSGEENDSPMLSDREKEVLVCLSQGKKNNEIADQLNISVHTVITHRKNIIKKTGIKSVAALTVYAILNNLIDEKDIL